MSNKNPNGEAREREVYPNVQTLSLLNDLAKQTQRTPGQVLHDAIRNYRDLIGSDT